MRPALRWDISTCSKTPSASIAVTACGFFFCYQSLAQLDQCYPQGGATWFLSQTDTQIFVALNDTATATAVSQRIGASTVQVVQESTGTSGQSSVDHVGQVSHSSSTNDSTSFSEVAREVLKPEEVLLLGQRQAVVFAPGVRPFLSRLVRDYEAEFQDALRPRRGGWLVLARSVLFLALAAAAAGAAALAVLGDWDRMLSEMAKRPAAASRR